MPVIGVFSMSVGEIWAFEAKVKVVLQALLVCHQFHI